MFNPQRRSKPSDIFMEEKALKLHLERVKSIARSGSPRKTAGNSKPLQEKYLQRLHNSKQEVKSRLSHNLLEQNHRLYHKLMGTEHRPQEYSQAQSTSRHHHSYFNHKKFTQRIRDDNFGMIDRMMHQSSMIPTLQQMERDFQQSKRYEKMVRKLPAILRHQGTAIKELTTDQARSSRYNSKASLRSSGTGRASRLSEDRAVTQEIRNIQQTLVKKQ